MKLTREDFDAWRASPLTELVLDRYIRDRMALARATHDAEAWGGPLTPDRHAVLREQYETLESLAELDFDDLSEWLQEQQER